MHVLRDGAPRVAKLVALTVLLSSVLPAVSAAAQSDPQPPPEVEVDAGAVASAFDAAPKSDEGADVIVRIASEDARAELEATPGVTVDPRSDGDSLAITVDDASTLTDLADRGAIEDVLPNIPLRSFYPSDPQWAQDCSSQQMATTSPCASVPSAGEPDWPTSIWRDTPGAADVRIAIIDTGVDASNPDLAGRVSNRLSFICPYPISSAHGTIVAQSAAARGANGIASAGVAWNAQILNYQVLGPNDGVCGNTYGLAWAIRAAGDDGADVINMSLGYEVTPPQSIVDYLQSAVDYARSRGSIVVAAAGNEQDVSPGMTVYPAALNGVIAVGAVDPTGAPETFSSRGSWVDVSAPNRVPAAQPAPLPPFLVGTSFAAPRVSGLLALMHSYNGGITEAEALSLLQSTVRPFNGVGTGMGVGIVSGTAAIAAMQTAPVCSSISSGYVLDGFGGLHSVGAAQSHPVNSNAYWPGWDIARGAALMPNDGGGYVVDAWGGIHPFGVGGGVSTPPATSSTAYWPGWDIVRDIAVLPDGTGGYLLDGWGGMHPFGIGGNPAPPMPVGTTYWPGWDVARSLVLTDTGGYVLDGWGGIHPFAIGPGGTTPPQLTGGPYWPGWDIARGIALAPGRAAGWLVDGWGGTHAMSAGGSADPKIRNTPYWTGWDIVSDVVTRDVC